MRGPARAIQIGIDGRKKAVEKFDVKTQGDCLYDFLRMVVRNERSLKSVSKKAFSPLASGPDVGLFDCGNKESNELNVLK